MLEIQAEIGLKRRFSKQLYPLVDYSFRTMGNWRSVQAVTFMAIAVSQHRNNYEREFF